VRFGEFSWSWLEPRCGIFDFAAYDHFMDLAQRCGLGVILCTPTCNPPPWLFAQYPDARQLDQRGRPHVGHRHQACYNHPAAYDLAQRAVLHLAEHFRDHPALRGWQVDNELTAGESGSPNQVYDYHPATIARYRQRLRETYESLAALNDAWVNNFWGNRYSTWDEIEPPRIGENRSVSPAAWLEWSRFRDKNVADLGQWQISWLRSVRSDFRIGANIPEVGPIASVWLGQDYWALCRGMDFIGADLYVYRNDEQAEQEDLAYSCDLIRSAAVAAGAEFGVFETQGGPHVLPWRMTFAGGMWQPDFLRRCVETYAAHGAQFILFFLWRAVRGGAEFGMNSLAEIDGSPSPRTRALPQIIAAGQAASDRLSDRPVAYIHYSQDSLRLCTPFDPDHTANTAYRGWHTLLNDLGYRVQFLNDDTLTSAGAGPLILPYSIVLSEHHAGLAASWICSGRRVIAGYATAFFDEFARIYPRAPGGPLAETLGVKIKGFDADLPLAVAGLPSGGRAILQSRITPAETGGGPANSLGQPMLVSRGTATYIGFDLGTLYNTSPNERETIRAWARATLGL
jgi:beta-galactosidase